MARRQARPPFPMATPGEMVGAWINFGMLWAESAQVISMRMLGMAGLWSVTPGENTRMVSEKAAAMTRAGTEAARAMMEGKRPDEVLAAGIRPIRRTTRSNSRRLAKRGPRLG